MQGVASYVCGKKSANEFAHTLCYNGGTPFIYRQEIYPAAGAKLKNN